MTFPSAMFTGPQLSVESAQALSSTVVRVTFSADPLQVSSGGVHDALNPTNYLLTGPSATYIVSIASVGSDVQSVDLTLGAAMAPGTWTVTCANIETPTSTPLNAPYAAMFILAASSAQAPISNGRTNEDAFQVLIQFIGPGVGVYQPGWQALLFALAQGDQYNWDSAEEAWNERFISTADTIYLSYLGASYGVTRPLNLGLSDELYRQLIIALKTNKLTESAFLEVLKIFYGVDAVSASATTTLSEPFNISTGMQLDVTIDSKFKAVINFSNASFQVPGMATAIELAAAITESFDMQSIDAYAIVYRVLGINYVRIYSVAKGGSSAVQVTGGNAQNYLQFPTLLVSADTSATWTVSQPSYGVSRFTTTGATTVDLSLVVSGDYANVFGAAFPSADRGSFPITAVYITYPASVLTQAFDVDTLGYAQAGIPISSPTDLMIFRPTKDTSFTTASRSVIVSSQGPQQVDVVIPATTQAVNRTEATAAYLQDPTILPAATSAVMKPNGLITITTTSGHGLSPGDQVIIDGIRSYPIYDTTHTSSPSHPNAYPAYEPAVNVGANSVNTSQSNLVTWQDLQTYPLAGSHHLYCTVTALNNFSLNNGDTYLVCGGGATTNDTSNIAETVVNKGPVTNADGSIGIQYWIQFNTTMSAARQGHAAVLLPSGKVLVCGGVYANFPTKTYLNTSDIYDPVMATWTAGPTMVTARALHKAILLSNGKVLICGGSTDDNTATNLCELYDPIANTFTSTGAMTVARTMFDAISLGSTVVLAAGGSTDKNNYWSSPGSITITNTAEMFNGSGWGAYDVGEMAEYRLSNKLLLLPSGQVWCVSAIGGQSSTSWTTASSNCEFFDPTTRRWYVGGAQALPADPACLTYLSSENVGVAICGGQVVQYDFTAGTTFDVQAPMASPFTVTAPAVILFNQTPPTWLITGYEVAGFPYPAVNLAVLGASALGGSWNGPATVNAVPTGTTFTYQNPKPSQYTNWSYGNISNAVLTNVAAPARQWPGPYIFDPQNGVAITGTQTTTTATYTAGNQYSSLAVSNASIFPNQEGYICLAFGLSNQIASLKYYGQQDSLHLLVDFGQVFTQTIPSGSTVTLLDGRGPFVPARNVPVGQFWSTDSPAGRAGAENAIGEVDAAGVNVDITITYPGDRGLGAEGYPTTGTGKQSDVVEVFSENYEGVK